MGWKAACVGLESSMCEPGLIFHCININRGQLAPGAAVGEVPMEKRPLAVQRVGEGKDLEGGFTYSLSASG